MSLTPSSSQPPPTERVSRYLFRAHLPGWNPRVPDASWPIPPLPARPNGKAIRFPDWPATPPNSFACGCPISHTFTPTPTADDPLLRALDPASRRCPECRGRRRAAKNRMRLEELACGYGGETYDEFGQRHALGAGTNTGNLPSYSEGTVVWVLRGHEPFRSSPGRLMKTAFQADTTREGRIIRQYLVAHGLDLLCETESERLGVIIRPEAVYQRTVEAMDLRVEWGPLHLRALPDHPDLDPATPLGLAAANAFANQAGRVMRAFIQTLANTATHATTRGDRRPASAAPGDRLAARLTAQERRRRAEEERQRERETCARKVQFDSESAAQGWATAYAQEHHADRIQRGYRCPVCYLWHLTYHGATRANFAPTDTPLNVARASLPRTRAISQSDPEFHQAAYLDTTSLAGVKYSTAPIRSQRPVTPATTTSDAPSQTGKDSTP